MTKRFCLLPIAKLWIILKKKERKPKRNESDKTKNGLTAIVFDCAPNPQYPQYRKRNKIFEKWWNHIDGKVFELCGIMFMAKSF